MKKKESNHHVFSMTRFWGLTAAVVLLIVSIAGCSGGKETPANTPAEEAPAGTAPAAQSTGGEESSKEGSEITVAVAAGPNTFDCMVSSASVDQRMGFHVFEQLVIFNGASELSPQLATAWESNADYTEWTFKLKEGVTFHDGSSFNSEDVVASTERYQRIGYRSLFADLDKVEALDDYTVKYTLKNGEPLFASYLGLPGMGMFFIYPAEYCTEEYDNELTVDQAIGTGPYQYSEYVIDDHVTMVKFEDYKSDDIPASGLSGERIAYFDKITWMIVPNAAQRLNGLVAGEYQYADDLDVSAWETLNNTEGIEPVVIENVWTPTTFLNTMAGPMADERIREAFLLCLNMDDCLFAGVGGQEELYELNPSVFFKDMVWWAEVEGMEKYNANDDEKAKSLLAEAGYNGEEITWMVTQEYPFMYQIAIMAQQQAAEIGLNIKLDVRDWATCAAALVNGSREKEWDMFTTAFSYVDIADPTGLESLFMIDQIVTPYESQEMTDIFLGGHSADQEERVKAYQEAMVQLYKDIPCVIYGNISSLSGQADNIGGAPQEFIIRMYNVFYE